jgi:hypothetical protein
MPRGWRKAPHGPTPTLSGIEGLVRGGRTNGQRGHAVSWLDLSGSSSVSTGQ